MAVINIDLKFAAQVILFFILLSFFYYLTVIYVYIVEEYQNIIDNENPLLAHSKCGVNCYPLKLL